MKELLSRLPFEFVEVPPGRFQSTWFGTTVEREVTYPLLMSATVLTVGQWKAVGALPSWLIGKDERYPAEGVSFRTAQDFVQTLGSTLGLPARYELSLPWEAEWELACRAGTSTRWWFGDSPERLGEHAWFYENARGRVHRVGELRANPFGLFDVYGNVCEWCLDDPVRPEAFAADALIRGRNILVVRGGSCYGSALECSSIERQLMPWQNPMNDPIGIRLVIRPAAGAS